MNRNAIEKLIMERAIINFDSPHQRGYNDGWNEAIDAVLALELVISPTVGDEAIISDGIQALRYLLNLAKEKPRQQVGTIMGTFTLKDNHTSRTDEQLERLWVVLSNSDEGSNNLKVSNSTPLSGDARKALDALNEMPATCNAERVICNWYAKHQETIRLALTQPPKIEGLDDNFNMEEALNKAEWGKDD